MGRISWWEGIPSGKDFLVGRNSRCEGFPSDKNFQEKKRKKISLWQVFPNSCGEGFPGGKNFLVGKMFTFITKSFLGQPKSKNYQNFSSVAGMYWLIKQPALPLNHSFKKLPQTLSFITKLLTAYSVCNISQFFAYGESAKKFFWATVHETRSFVQA